MREECAMLALKDLIEFLKNGGDVIFILLNINRRSQFMMGQIQQ